MDQTPLGQPVRVRLAARTTLTNDSKPQWLIGVAQCLHSFEVLILQAQQQRNPRQGAMAPREADLIYQAESEQFQIFPPSSMMYLSPAASFASAIACPISSTTKV